MKILFITSFIPYPLNSGGNQAVFNMVDEARKLHEVTMLLCVQSHSSREAVEELQKVWPNVKFLCYSMENGIDDSRYLSKMTLKNRLLYRLYDFIGRSMKRKMARRRRKVMNLQPDFIREHSMLFSEDNVIDEGFLEYIYNQSRNGYDLIQVEFYQMLPVIYALPGDAETVFVHHELRFVRNENEMSLFSTHQYQDEMTYLRLKDEEIACLSRYSHIITLTQTDKEILSRYLPDKDIYVSPAITDTIKNLDKLKDFTPSKDLVFVGSGDHFPNADGIRWFCTDVMKSLRTRGVMPKLYISGVWNNTIKTSITSANPEVTFTGFVDDLSAFLNGKISIVPIRIGSGMRMKIIDSISASSPLVTTSKGCEGLPCTNNENCLIADTADSFADAIIKMSKDEKLQKRCAENAIITLRSTLDAGRLLQTRMQFYNKLQH